MNDKKPDNDDELEEEMAGGGFNKGTPPHFDDEIEYLNEQGNKPKSFMAGFFNLSKPSVGWLGVLLLVLVVLFLFLPKGGGKIDNEELIILKSRVEDLENRQSSPSDMEGKLRNMESDVLKGVQAGDRLDQLEMLLVSKMDVLEKEVDILKKQMEDAKVQGTAQKAPVAEPKTVTRKEAPKPAPKAKEPVQTQSATYHTVQKGENVYRIGLKYNLTEAQLLELNGLNQGTTIYPGQKLKVRK